MTDTLGLVPALQSLIAESPQLDLGGTSTPARVAAVMAPLLAQAASGSAPNVGGAEIYAVAAELTGILTGSKMVRPVATPPGMIPKFPEAVLPFTRYPMTLFAFIINTAIAIRGSAGDVSADDFMVQVVLKRNVSAVATYVASVVTVV